MEGDKSDGYRRLPYKDWTWSRPQADIVLQFSMTKASSLDVQPDLVE